MKRSIEFTKRVKTVRYRVFLRDDGTEPLGLPSFAGPTISTATAPFDVSVTLIRSRRDTGSPPAPSRRTRARAAAEE